MKQIIRTLIILVFMTSSHLLGQITFDYSGAELVLEHFTDSNINNADKIVNHPGYRHVILHSKRYSSKPMTEEDLRKSLNGMDAGFDFSYMKAHKDEGLRFIQYLKENEKDIIDNYTQLCLKYLPDNYKQKATVYYIIGGYNGIAFNDKICMNIDYQQFRENHHEIKLYIAHELFHIGFEKYHSLPDISKANTIKDLKEIVLATTMNEGLATLTPYHKRMEMNEISDYDYKVLLDTSLLHEKINSFDSVIQYLDKNIDKKLTEEILEYILGQCSQGRLFYVVGCYMGLKIEEKYGENKIQELVKENPQMYFDTYYQIVNNK